jgi:hypothetical protein
VFGDSAGDKWLFPGEQLVGVSPARRLRVATASTAPFLSTEGS